MDTGLLKSLFNNQLPEVDRVVILRHITPDGDAVGSAYGLAGLILENTSKDVLIVNYNDIYNVGALKHIADLTTKVNEVNANEENVVLTKSDLVVVVDVAQVNRTAGVNALVNTEAAAGVVVVDHHPANEEQLAAIESS